MSKRPPRTPRRGATKRPGRRRRGTSVEPEGPTLLDEIALALTDGPLALLGLASSMLVALDPPSPGPFDPSPADGLPSRTDLVETLLDVPSVETSALLTALAELSGDDLLRHRVRGELAGRGHPLPGWLSGLGRVRPGRVVEMTHVLGDGDNLMIDVPLAGGDGLTIVVYVDHNLGTLVKDAFVIPERIDSVVIRMRELSEEEPDTTWTDLDPADARARIDEAIELGAMTFPPIETESWPACRPLVEWALRGMPAGGTGHERPDWDDDALAALTVRFFGSAFGADRDDADGRDLLQSLLWFGTDYGPGDPMRWSPVAVELLLVDWIPRKIMADPEYLAAAPDLLRRFVRFCHHERGIRAELTEQTLAAVDEHEPQYLDRIGADGPMLDDHLAVAAIVLNELTRAVGAEALNRLGTDPLPDEPLDRAAIPPDVLEAVATVADRVDRFCDDELDVEFRTACRRFLVRVAAGDPQIFRRRAKAETTAAAVVWVIGRANDLFRHGGLLVKDMIGYFGAGQNVAQRANPMLAAVGVDPHDQVDGVHLGTPDLLVSERRRHVVELRDRYRGTVE